MVRGEVFMDSGQAFGRLASNIAPEPIDWLWQSYIPDKTTTLAGGDPDAGKTLLSIDIAARVSARLSFPDGSAPCESGAVVILNAEDHAASLTVPRLAAAGADLSKITLVGATAEDGRLVDLSRDLQRLERTIRAVNAKLVIVDPLAAYLGKVNYNRDPDVRQFLAPLAAMAERVGVALVIVAHLNKAAQVDNAIYRIGGSIGIIGSVRAAFLVARDPQDDGLRVMTPSKFNIGPRPAALTYRIVEENGAARVRWEGRSTHTARSLLQQQRPLLEKEKAVVALRDLLKDGPRPVKEIENALFQADVTVATYKRARRELGVVPLSAKHGRPPSLALPGVDHPDLPASAETPESPETVKSGESPGLSQLSQVSQATLVTRLSGDGQRRGRHPN
jgi:RecA-family ATPase